MEEKITAIREWLGTGSINVFGLPMSGKDTQGVKLAEVLGAKFLSSGLIIRAMEKASGQSLTADGSLAPTNLFYEWVLPYFERRELIHVPLILSSIGRWSGEEQQVITIAEGSGHPIKAVVLLNVSESDVTERWETAQTLGDRGDRPDDAKPEAFQKRLAEFRDKTMPVIRHYQDLDLLVTVRGDMSRDEVFEAMIDALYKYSQTH